MFVYSKTYRRDTGTPPDPLCPELYNPSQIFPWCQAVPDGGETT